jgi:hypothetical protein
MGHFFFLYHLPQCLGYRSIICSILFGIGLEPIPRRRIRNLDNLVTRLVIVCATSQGSIAFLNCIVNNIPYIFPRSGASAT